MISTSQAYDMLPFVVDLYDKIEADSYVKKAIEENKGKKLDQLISGIDIFKFILKNSAKVKNEVFEIVAIFQDKTVEEIKAQNFVITVKSLKEIFSDKEAVELFVDAIR